MSSYSEKNWRYKNKKPDDKVFDLVEGGENLNLFVGDFDDASKQELHDMYSLLKKINHDGGEDYGVQFNQGTSADGQRRLEEGESLKENEEYSVLKGFDKEMTERIKSYDWFQTAVNLKKEDIFTAHPMAPRGEDYDQSQYNRDTPLVRITDTGLSPTSDHRATQQYESVLRSYIGKLEEHGLGLDYVPETYTQIVSLPSLDGGRTLRSKTEIVEGKETPLYFINSAPHANIKNDRYHTTRYNRYNDLLQKYKDEGFLEKLPEINWRVVEYTGPGAGPGG